MQINSVSQLTNKPFSELFGLDPDNNNGKWYVEVSNGTTSYKLNLISFIKWISDQHPPGGIANWVHDNFVHVSGDTMGGDLTLSGQNNNIICNGNISCNNEITTTNLSCKYTAQLTAQAALWS